MPLVTISGVFADKYGRTIMVGSMMGEMTAGAGPGTPPPDKPPIVPPDLGIWPSPPEGQAPLPGHPIALPGDPWWPGNAPKPPELPAPGSPPVILPGFQPVNPMTPPPAIVVDYPGIGKVLVPQPLPPS